MSRGRRFIQILDVAKHVAAGLVVAVPKDSDHYWQCDSSQEVAARAVAIARAIIAEASEAAKEEP